jgi:hypothetical protein
MAEVNFDVTTVGVDYVCDECKKGLMLFTKFLVDSVHEKNPYLHTCNNCNHEETFPEKYPTIRHLRKQS